MVTFFTPENNTRNCKEKFKCERHKNFISKLFSPIYFAYNLPDCHSGCLFLILPVAHLHYQTI